MVLGYDTFARLNGEYEPRTFSPSDSNIRFLR